MNGASGNDASTTSVALIEQAKAAINALSAPSETLRANEWLVEFERSFAAWEVAPALLASPLADQNGNSFRFFGAKFLYSKIQRQYFQLSPEAVKSLAESLVQNILKFVQETYVEFNVCRYLCLALSALLLQMNQQGSINQILQWLNPIITICPRVLLELLILLPEECFNRNIDVSSSSRSEFIEQLAASSNDVLSFLATLWPSITAATTAANATDSGSGSVQSKILQCAGRWIDITALTAEALTRHPIFPLVLQALTASNNNHHNNSSSNSIGGELFEYAVDAVLVILQRYRSRDTRIVDCVLPVILSLRSCWQQQLQQLMTELQQVLTDNSNSSNNSSGGDLRSKITDPITGQLQYYFMDDLRDELDEDALNTCRSMCRLFTESAEACLDLFLTTRSRNYRNNNSSNNSSSGSENVLLQQQQEQLLQQLIECTKFPFDPSISRIPLKFFYELAIGAQQPAECDSDNSSNSSSSGREAAQSTTMPAHDGRHSNNNNNNSSEEVAAQAALNQKYSPVFLCLLEVSMQQLALPDAVLQRCSQLSDAKSDLRAEWKETVLDCCHVLGGSSAMQQLCAHLQQEMQRAEAAAATATMVQQQQQQQQLQLHWSKVEIVLLCLQLVAPFMSRHEDVFIPQVLRFAFSLPAAGDQLPLLRRAVVELFGRCAFWLEFHADFLPPILTSLVADLSNNGSSNSGSNNGSSSSSGGSNSAAAAKAIMNIFRNCSRLPQLPIEQLHNKVVELRATIASDAAAAGSDSNTTAAFTLDSELLLLEALAVVAANLPAAEAENAFKSFVLPVASELNQQLLLLEQQQQQQRGTEVAKSGPDAALLGPYVDRLTVLLQYFRVDAKFVADVFVSLLPLFQRIFEICPSEKMCEKSCRFYKHAMRSTSRHFAPFVPAMAAHLSEQFQRLPLPAFLYAGATCIASFARPHQQQQQQQGGSYDDNSNSSCVPALYQMLWSMSGTFFQLFRSPEDFQQQPDIVEEYFYLMAKALQYCPAPFLQAQQQQQDTVLQAALSALSIHHREAQKGVLMFLERVVGLASYWPESELMAREAARKFVQRYAAAIVQANFLLLSGELPAYALDESNGCISDVLWHLRKQFKQDFPGWLASVLPSLPAGAQQVALKLNLQAAIDSSRSLKDFSTALERFELTCRRNV